MSSVSGFGRSPATSMPSSASDSTASAFSEVPGSVPADVTATASPAACRMRAAASWDLPPLRAQTKTTCGMRSAMDPPVGTSPAGGASS